MATVAVEVVYRGVFQKSLAKEICRGIVFAARKEGRIGTAFGRYGDSPERNGIPAKQYAVVADGEEELEVSLSKYEPAEVDVTVALDDTLCKGVESWAWYGLQPVNTRLKENGTLIVTSIQPPEELIGDIHRKDAPYNLAILPGQPSFSGMWVYRDDHTDVRVLGALAKSCPQLFGLASVQQAVKEQWKSDLKVASARKAYERLVTHLVEPGEGNPKEAYSYQLLPWQEMQEGVVVPAVPKGNGFRGGDQGFEPARNPHFKKFSTRSMRPVVNFDTCAKCTLCWLHCPDGCFDITPEGLYDANMNACCGCGICEEVCPVKGTITMVNEALFTANGSQYEAWKTQGQERYHAWLEERLSAQKALGQCSHGYRHKGQYEAELAQASKEAQ